MRLAVPVAVSNTSSLAEITRGVGLLFNPFKVEEIAQAMKKLSSDEDLRKQLVQKGLKRSKLFTWKSYYEKMMETLNSY
jgi:glycosyltransferase involved in cell wall biosynthesis